jgi:hypothetical protein
MSLRTGSSLKRHYAQTGGLLKKSKTIALEMSSLERYREERSDSWDNFSTASSGGLSSTRSSWDSLEAISFPNLVLANTDPVGDNQLPVGIDITALTLANEVFKSSGTADPISS